VSFGIVSWIKAQGFAKPLCVVGGLILAVGCIGIPVSFGGKRLRQYIHSRWGMNEAGAVRPQ
jgi:hypothetical protein